ncbi:N-acetylmuramoyl-L-alanine amidase [Clostridioides difficile]|nr:N-acetylmuramoyl-L-alanine amidase [Clostridioides difficile]HBF6046655.1 N-acetylmuramoyl-L-alanine amidase [Clostridioides difficile]HBH0227662.1 N-acetylmuramoyl-L-alanine amidase [Clostridioides difficile]
MNYNILNIHGGHNPKGKIACGATGLIDESLEDRKVKDEVVSILRANSKTVYDCTVENGTSKTDVLKKIVSKCNSHKVDLDISIHFNSGAKDEKGNGKTTGVEVFIYNEKTREVATKICESISKLGFKNRGVKIDKDLYVLRNTKAPAILIECCFVDDRDDVELYNYKSMSKAIVEAILNKKINNGGKKMHKYTIVYEGEIDKISATIMSWNFKENECKVCDIKDYVPGQTQNLYVVGGVACEKIGSMTKEKFTMIKGNDRFDTLYKALEFINK